MRITNNMMNTGFLQDLQRSLRTLNTMQRRVNTGKTISRPSDDPVRLQQAFKLDTAIDQHQQYIRNIDSATGWLEGTDAALHQINELVIQAKGIAVQGATGTNDQSAMEALADEMRQVSEALVTVANGAHAGLFLFAGSNTTTKPYGDIDWESGLPVVFQGNKNGMPYEIGPAVTLPVNTVAEKALGTDGIGTIELFRRLESALRVDDKDAINVAMGELEDAENTLLTARSEVGARMNRLDATKTRFRDDLVTYTALKSDAEDVDVAEAIMYLKTQESVYHASLAIGARLLQPTLVDFLR